MRSSSEGGSNAPRSCLYQAVIFVVNLEEIIRWQPQQRLDAAILKDKHTACQKGSNCE